MNKVYSLDTYRDLKKTKTKEEALNGIKIATQEDLDNHYKNIETIANRNKDNTEQAIV